MRTLRRLFRLSRLLPHIAFGMLLARWVMPAQPPPRTEREWATLRNWHRKALAIVGVHVRLHGECAEGPVLFAANHVSWLDIGALSTVIDAGFIGKSELRDWPVLGFLIARGGTIFIRRGGRDAAATAAAEMAKRLARGDRAAVFPEGTTTRGFDMRHFHPRLFEAARKTGVPVQPVAVVYDSPVAPFVDDDTFPLHLWQIMGEPRITVDVHLLPPIDTRDRDRRSIARDAEQAVREVVHALPSGEPRHS